jgi:sec-independent protein translocase protein TatB
VFNIGSGELALIAVVALLVLGPRRLPELARGIGKFMREFRRQTDEVRGIVEREFYKMDQELPTDEPPPPSAAPDALPANTASAAEGASSSDAVSPVTSEQHVSTPFEPGQTDALPAPAEHMSSQVMRGLRTEDGSYPPASPSGEKS